ncbi:hypothetical protein LDO31_18260 [Luteimonas sp. XNQY3]|nr:hypothetical protein [Luteimonas sp. XNQY3]MCD9008143.1 hypothetical protein [Luteimonas sp. XNQY3]
MDILTFIAELVKAAAWPLAAVAIALIFRQQLRALLSRIRKGKVGLAEFEFEQEIRDLAEQLPVEPVPTQVGTPTVALATTNPRAAILEAWLGVETSMTQLAKSVQLPKFVHPRNTSAVLRVLESAGALAPEDAALFNDLRTLRNQATHDADFSPSPESVIQYVQLANGLKQRISSTASER